MLWPTPTSRAKLDDASQFLYSARRTVAALPNVSHEELDICIVRYRGRPGLSVDLRRAACPALVRYGRA